jgi:hypothetical protein
MPPALFKSDGGANIIKIAFLPVEKVMSALQGRSGIAVYSW